MGSKKKTSSNNDKSPKPTQSNDQHKNGTKSQKQSPKPNSSGGKQSPKPSSSGGKQEKKKHAEKTKHQDMTAARWMMIIVISSMVAGGAVLYTCPSVHDQVGKLLLKYFHPDILSAVNTFMFATKVSSKTSEGAVPSSKTEQPEEQIVKDKTRTEQVKNKENVEQSEKSTKKSPEQTQPKDKDKSQESKKTEKKETKTKADDKPVIKEAQPKHKDKPQEDKKSKQSETKTKQDDKLKQEDKKSKESETKTKPDDKLKQEDKKSKEQKKESETKTKPNDEFKKEDKKSKEQKKETVTKQDGSKPAPPPPVESKTEQKPKVEKTSNQKSQSTDQSGDDQKSKKKTKDEETETAKSKDDAKTKESEENVKSKVYSKASVTNTADNVIRSSLDEADRLFEEKQYKESLEAFDQLLLKYPKSPRALYGKALTLNQLAEEYRSNEILERCIRILTDFMDLDSVPDDLYKTAGRKLFDRQQFRGWGLKASKTLLRLTERFPDDLQLSRELGVSYLMIGRNDPAQVVFENILKDEPSVGFSMVNHDYSELWLNLTLKDKILKIKPSDGFAMVHLGFILKTIREEYERGIQLLADGIDTQDPGTEDGRFYFHLGDALQRRNRTDEAYHYYRIGAEKKLFPSIYQRSMYNVDYLTPRPWWTIEETGYAKYFKLLEDNWEIIRDEGLAQLDEATGSFRPEDEKLRETGSWKQFTLYSQGRRHESACAKAPKTCALIEQIPDAKGCSRGQTKFSVMKPGVHVWPHCGPTNCRIRAHLGLVIPPGPKIRVINDTREWIEGKMIVFDDSFEHEVWHYGNETRMVLIVDFWHPELTEDLKKRLPPI